MQHTLIIVDGEEERFDIEHLEVLTFEQYLNDYPKRDEPKTRIINLCNMERYLSKGYYCSLLAEARKHRVLPSVKAINELRDIANDSSAIIISGKDFVSLGIGPEKQHLMVYFGKTENPAYKKFARKIFEQHYAPILRLSLWREANNNVCVKIVRYDFGRLNEEEKAHFMVALASYTQLVWRSRSSRKRHRWDMAILVNPEEKVPPSSKEAISRFIKAASKLGIHAETVTAQQLDHVSQYDALFIRETTAIDHHTYRLARKAEESGLVVMDDPTSILRCCNKVYLHDAFSYQHVPSLRTEVVISTSDEALDKIERNFNYPLVLKMPEGSFSKGVFKVSDREALKTKLTSLFCDTALVLVQEYLYTEFDWRIGVLNGRAIYACRYYMARNHWQIYNHESKRFNSGDFDTIPTFEAPKSVLDAAVKACNIVGNGLYGVDLKQKDNHVYVIEVNDNPSIEYKIEDLYMGDELYMLIMAEFQQRLEKRGR